MLNSPSSAPNSPAERERAERAEAALAHIEEQAPPTAEEWHRVNDALAEAKLDVERLDLLEKHPTPFEVVTLRESECLGDFKYIEHSNGHHKGKTLRAAIDAARKEKGEQKEMSDRIRTGAEQLRDDVAYATLQFERITTLVSALEEAQRALRPLSDKYDTIPDSVKWLPDRAKTFLISAGEIMQARAALSTIEKARKP